MKFVHPGLINLLWVLIPIFGVMIYGLRQRKKIISAFVETKMLKIIVPGYDPKRRWIKSILIIIALGFAVIALSEPQMGFRWEKIEQKGVDIMIALDVSKSMLAQDIKPNRLERAKREIIDLLKMMKSDRAGLVAFSGKALLQCPLTLDHDAFNIFLRVLEPGYLPIGGTNLAEAIQTSFDGFEKDTNTQKAIILITDGENTSGDVEKIAKQMAKENIKIFCIGVGDPGGAPIPDEKGGFKKDSSGNIIMSKVDEKGLKRLANLTNGAYVRSVAGNMDLDLIYIEKILGTMTRKTLTSGKKKVWENRYQWFLFPCFILLLIELAISPGKRKPGKRKLGKRKPSKTKPGKMIFILFFILFSFHTEPAQAESIFSSVTKGIAAFKEKQYEPAKKHFIDAQLEQPDNPKHYYNIGTAAYMNQEFDQAEKNLIQAAKSTDPKINHDALYNLANAYYKMGKLDESISGYEQILEKFPEDTQAKENLEFVKKKKEEEQNQKDHDNKDQENKDQEKDEKQNNDKQDKNKDQNKQQDQPDKNKQEEKEKPENNQDSSKDKEKDQPEDQPKEQNSAGDENKEQEPESSQSVSPSEAEEMESKQAKQNLENKLNRLEDKPGQAMMPLIQDKYVEKDW